MARQISPRVLTEALAVGGAEAERAFTAMVDMGKIDTVAPPNSFSTFAFTRSSAAGHA
jgi:hypothetical protein